MGVQVFSQHLCDFLCMVFSGHTGIGVIGKGRIEQLVHVIHARHFMNEPGMVYFIGIHGVGEIQNLSLDGISRLNGMGKLDIEHIRNGSLLKAKANLYRVHILHASRYNSGHVAIRFTCVLYIPDGVKSAGVVFRNIPDKV